MFGWLFGARMSSEASWLCTPASSQLCSLLGVCLTCQEHMEATENVFPSRLLEQGYMGLAGRVLVHPGWAHAHSVTCFPALSFLLERLN